MSKELNALEKIKKCLFWSDEGLNDIAIIEQALKDKEKRDAVLAIMKEKPQSVLWFIQYCDKCRLCPALVWNYTDKKEGLKK